MKVINHMCLNEAVARSYRLHLTTYVNFSNEARVLFMALKYLPDEYSLLYSEQVSNWVVKKKSPLRYKWMTSLDTNL